MKKILLCFDLDNTLINSEKAHVLAYNSALEMNGYKKTTFNKLVKLLGRPNKEVVKILIKSKNKKEINKVLNDHYYFLINKYYKHVKIFPGVITVLKKLKKSYNIAVISNASHKSILALLRGAHIDRRLFDIIIGNDDVRRPKPWADEILKVERLLHRKAQYMIGDSIYDVMAGKRAKIKTIAILSGRYGKNRLIKYNPDYIIKTIKDLLKIIC